jgi:hypothetical protein
LYEYGWTLIITISDVSWAAFDPEYWTDALCKVNALLCAFTVTTHDGSNKYEVGYDIRTCVISPKFLSSFRAQSDSLFHFIPGLGLGLSWLSSLGDLGVIQGRAGEGATAN